jgi:nicotinate-nucleotide adenylyltransferase
VRIGVFGGTFDPPHVGHLILAADAFEALRLDKLFFVPARAQPLKVDRPAIASAAERLEMVRLAIKGDVRYAVDDTEINREGLSFTVDTLEGLSARFEGAQLFLLLGEDSLASFDRWRKPERIRELATLAVMYRARHGGGTKTSRPSLKRKGVETLSTRQIDVSSTEIRQRLSDGRSIRGFVPESVEKFIASRRLYQTRDA